MISCRSGSATWERRQRLRKAMATAFLAALADDVFVQFMDDFLGSSRSFQGLEGEIAVGVDANISGDLQRFLVTIAAGSRSGVLEQRPRRTGA